MSLITLIEDLDKAVADVEKRQKAHDALVIANVEKIKQLDDAMAASAATLNSAHANAKALQQDLQTRLGQIVPPVNPRVRVSG